MLSRNSLRNFVSRALASTLRQTDRRLQRRNSRAEQLETRALLAVFTVNSMADAGTGSLRQAILDANGAAGADQIVFAPSTNGTEFDLATGQMTITESVIITGNGTSRTVIDGQQLSRIFDITAGDVTLQRLTLKNGRTTANNEFGGAIRSTSTGTLTISESTVQGNSTTGTGSEGGAIRLQNGSIRITDSTFQGNSTAGANARGGAIFSRAGTVQLIRSTLSGNSTAGINAAGGAIFTYLGAAHTTLIQSTVSGNSTAGTNAPGGAVFSVFGNVTVGQSTVTSNLATLSGGGGIFSYSSPLTIFNSIVAGNTDNGTAPDLQKAPSDALTVSSSLIGRNTGTGLMATGTTPDVTGNLIGGDTDGTKIDPLFGPLSDNGGRTQSHALLTGSPAIDRGDNSLAVDVTNSNSVLPSDQRGNPFGRFAAASVDMGAYERQTVTGLSLIVNTNQDENDGNYAAGDLSLREAIGLANGSLGANTITLATTTNGTEFNLLLGELFVTETLTITGNGATNTVIDGQQLSRILNLQTGDLTLDGVTLKNGKTTAMGNGGGAIASSSSGVLTIRNSTLSGNSTAGATAKGGAIYTNSGAVTISQSIVSGNSTAGVSADGGGIFSGSGAVTLTNSTVSGNSTAEINAKGGGIFASVGAVTLTNSTVSGNTTSGDSAEGGGIYAGIGAVALTNSTVSGNSTAGSNADGGGIYAGAGAVTLANSTFSGNQVTGTDSDGGGVWFDDSVVTVVNSTITGNSASRAGGGLRMLADSSEKKLTIQNSIIAGNTAASNPDFTAPTTPATNLEVRFSLIGRSDGTSLTATAGTTPGANGNLIGGTTDPTKIDPLLAPLANNGGPTQTHALLINSPAINRGSNTFATGLTTDQRGNPFARIASTTVDMGAYERQTLSNLSLIVDTNRDENDGNYATGDLSLREAIGLANGSLGANTITFATTTNGTEFDLTLGEMFVTETLTITGNGAANTVIDAQQFSRIFNFQSGAFILNAVTLTRGRPNGGDSTGGAIKSTSTGLLSIQDSILIGNRSPGSTGGGAIYSDTGAVTITRTTLSGNFTTGTGTKGGAIFARSGAVTVNQSTLAGNFTVDGAADGGAIYALSGAVTISQSTLSDNSTAGDSKGGAICALQGAVTVSQSTLSGNITAGMNANGGAIFARFGAVTISQSTLTLNNAAQSTGGAIFSYSAPLTIRNSIVAGNMDSGLAADVSKSPNGDDAFTVTNSLIGRNNGTGLTATGLTPGVNGNLIGGATDGTKINPLLASLANNGGPTLTHALLVNSPAFNRGSNALALDVTQAGNPALTIDQRGTNFVRIFAGTVDMGAIETRTSTGTTGNDAFTLTYSSTTTAGTVSVTVSTDSGPVVNLGTFPMNSPLTLNGLGGTDSVRVVGNTGADTIVVNSSTGLTVNGASLILTSIENRTLAGAAGSDVYKFDVDSILGLWTLDESGGGTDTVDFSPTTTVGLTLNMGTAATQVVHATNLSLALGSAATYENLIGGSGADTLFGNSLANTLSGGAGDDKLIGAGGSDLLLGGPQNDTYIFVPATAAEADQVMENPNEGTDTLTFAYLTSSVVVNLGSTSVQSVHTNRTLKLNSAVVFENLDGGSGADTLFGNTLSNSLIGGAGDDKLLGAGGNDVMRGGANNDTYIFVPATSAEADQVIENANEGVDSLNFGYLMTSVALNLGSASIQPVHTNRTLKLNSVSTFENAVGGAASDMLLGNAVANRLTGGSGHNILVGMEGSDILEAGSGRDILIGGLGLDILKGDAGDDILIAGRTTNDTNLGGLNTLRAQWISGNAYATRITNLRAGVGSPVVSLKAKINALNDSEEDDVLYGGTGTDWFFRALDDVITDLVSGESLDLL